MKFIAILLGFGGFVSAIEQVKYRVPEEKLQKVKNFGNTCAAELNMDTGVLAGVIDGTAQRTHETNKYFFCILGKLNIVDEVGHVAVDKVVLFLNDHPLLEKFKTALLKCNEVIKENPVETLASVKYKLPEEISKKIQKVGNTCAAELKIDPGLFIGVAEGTGQRTEETNKYLYCLLDKLKLVDEFGHANVDKVSKNLGNHALLEGFKEALSKCNEVTKENPVETLASVHICYFETSPVLFEF